MQEADGLVMGSSSDRFLVHTRRTIENEMTTDVITVTDQNGAVLLESTVVMDHDLGGTGFVKAMQADADPELEVVAWGNNIRQGTSFFLDYQGGKILTRPFEESSMETQQLVENFKKVNTTFPSLLFLLVVATPVYYILYYIVKTVGGAFIKGMRGE